MTELINRQIRVRMIPQLTQKEKLCQPKDYSLHYDSEIGK